MRTSTNEVISVMVDQEADRLQILVDDELVFEETETEFDFVGADGAEWGWDLGTAWGRDVDGQITGFAIDDDVEFVDTYIAADDLFA